MLTIIPPFIGPPLGVGPQPVRKIYLGSVQLDVLYFGSTSLSAVYLGSTLLYRV